MVTLAPFYAVTLAVQLQLPAPGPAYYPKTCMEVIEVLAEEISDMRTNARGDGIIEAINLMRFPVEIVGHFRSRLR